MKNIIFITASVLLFVASYACKTTAKRQYLVPFADTSVVAGRDWDRPLGSLAEKIIARMAYKPDFVQGVAPSG